MDELKAGRMDRWTIGRLERGKTINPIVIVGWAVPTIWYGIPGQEETDPKGLVEFYNIDGIVKSPLLALNVIPAKAGIQQFKNVIDSRLRGNDLVSDFLRVHQYWISNKEYPMSKEKITSEFAI